MFWTRMAVLLYNAASRCMIEPENLHPRQLWSETMLATSFSLKSYHNTCNFDLHMYVTWFEKRGHFAQNAIFYHFSTYHSVLGKCPWALKHNLQFGLYGRLPVIKILYVCIEAATVIPWNGVHGRLSGTLLYYRFKAVRTLGFRLGLLVV